MNMPTDTATPYYRIDSFVVPDAAKTEFLERVLQTHALLRQQDGFRQDFIVEQPLGDATTKVVTVAEWESESVVASVRQKVQAMHAEAGFNPQELFARLGIKAELGSYRPVEGMDR